MSALSYFNLDGTTIPVVDEECRANVGNLSSLQTTSKNNLVSAINEVFSSVGGITITYDENTSTMTITTV